MMAQKQKHQLTRKVTHEKAYRKVSATRQGLRGCQHPVNCTGEGRARVFDQVVHLILHQGLERGEDHRQQAAAHMPNQRRQLETERLAASRGKNRQQGRAPASRLERFPAGGYPRPLLWEFPEKLRSRKTASTAGRDRGSICSRRIFGHHREYREAFSEKESRRIHSPLTEEWMPKPSFSADRRSRCSSPGRRPAAGCGCRSERGQSCSGLRRGCCWSR